MNRLVLRFSAGLIVGLLLFTGRLQAGEEAAKLPDGVAPLTEKMQKQLDHLQTEASRLRGLKYKTPVRVGQLDEPTLKKKIVTMFAEEMPPEKMDPVERGAKAFGLIPQDMDLKTYYPKLLTSQVGGFYEPKKKYLVLVDREGGVLGPGMDKKLSPETRQRLAESVLVHELVHALQDHHYDLEKYGHDTPLSDPAAAKLALIEGDATLAMQSFMMKMDVERMPGALAGVKASADNPMQAVNGMPNMPGAKELAEAPAFIRDSLLFSYTQGLVFVMSLRMEGGQKLLDHAFADDPPTSTEQILHPEKWIRQRDNPVQIEMPDLSTSLPGYKKISAGNLGEFGVRLVLLERLGEKAREQAFRAAAGWGGDAFALYAKEKDEVLVWVTEWDTPGDATEFKQIVERDLKGWSVSTPIEKRVVLVKGQLEAAALGAVQKLLSSAKATVSDKKAPDMAALGITAEDRPKPLGIADLTKTLQDPVVKELMQMAMGGGEGGKDDVGKLLEMAGEVLGEDGTKALEGLLKDENVQKELAKLLEPPKQEDAGKVADRTYSNKQYGLSIVAPEGEPAWKVNTKPTQPPMGARAIVEFSPPEGVEGKVALVVQNLPMPVAPEQMAPMMEMVLQAQFKGFKKVKSGPVKSGEVKGLEMEFTGTTPVGVKVRVLQRMYSKGHQMFTVLGTTNVETWEKYGKAIRKSVESLSFEKASASENEKAPNEKPPAKKERSETLTE